MFGPYELMILGALVLIPAAMPAALSGKNAAKKPWLAAVLNFVGWPFAGAMGYSYLHRWGRYFAAFLSRLLVAIVLNMDSPEYWIIVLPLWGIVVWDSYRLAKGSSAAERQANPQGDQGEVGGSR